MKAEGRTTPGDLVYTILTFGGGDQGNMKRVTTLRVMIEENRTSEVVNWSTSESVIRGARKSGEENPISYMSETPDLLEKLWSSGHHGGGRGGE